MKKRYMEEQIIGAIKSDLSAQFTRLSTACVFVEKSA